MALLISAVPHPVQNDVAAWQCANQDAWVGSRSLKIIILNCYAIAHLILGIIDYDN